MVSNGGSTGIRHKFDLEKSPKDSKSELYFSRASANFREKTFSMNVDAFHFEKLCTMLQPALHHPTASAKKLVLQM